MISISATSEMKHESTKAPQQKARGRNMDYVEYYVSSILPLTMDRRARFSVGLEMTDREAEFAAVKPHR
jgi:hypothetical protein